MHGKKTWSFAVQSDKRMCVFIYSQVYVNLLLETIARENCQKIVDIVYANAWLLMAVKFLVKHYQINVP